jgi:hypothetical protein
MRMGMHEPDEQGECTEAINTQGRVCKNCQIDKCYRKGMSKSQATSDNKRLVANRLNDRTLKSNGYYDCV